MSRNPPRAAAAVLGAVLVLQSLGCGTILYPDRRGQKSGRIDAGVAVLDGVGLLFFILPGVIAFAVDFSDGAIYLPASAPRSPSVGRVERLNFEPGDDARGRVESLVLRRTGVHLSLDQADMRVIRLNSKDEMFARLARPAGG